VNSTTFNRACKIDEEVQELCLLIRGIKESENTVKIVFTWSANEDVGAIDAPPYKLNKYLRAEVLKILESRQRVLKAEWKSL